MNFVFFIELYYFMSPDITDILYGSINLENKFLLFCHISRIFKINSTTDTIEFMKSYWYLLYIKFLRKGKFDAEIHKALNKSLSN